MLSNLVSASHLTTSSNRQYSPHNHCEYMEMAVAPSAFEAHASRTYVIEENIESGTQNNNSQHHAGMQQTQRPCAPPSLGMLLGINAFGVMGQMGMHPSHLMYQRNLQNSKQEAEKNSHELSTFRPIQPAQSVAGKGGGERDAMLKPENVV